MTELNAQVDNQGIGTQVEDNEGVNSNPQSLSEMEDYDMSMAGFTEDEPTPSTDDQTDDPANPADANADANPEMDSAKYHQSRADKFQQMLQDLGGEDAVNAIKTLGGADAVQRLAALDEFLSQNPDVVQAAQNRLNGESPKDDSTPELVAPEKPQKPQDYEPYEAQNDPDSASAKYHQELEAYQEKMIEYRMALVEKKIFDAQREREQAAIQQQAAQQQRATQMSTIRETAKTMGVEDPDDFMRWANSPESLKPDVWVQAYRYAKGLGTASKQKVAEFEQVKRNSNTPVSVVNTPKSEVEAPMSFLASLGDGEVTDY